MICPCCLSDNIKFRPLGLGRYYRCLRCGLIFIPLREEQCVNVARHYEEIDPHETVAAAKEAFFKYALNQISGYFRDKNGSILDVGCGFGYFLNSAAREGWATWGVEIVPRAVRQIEEEKNRHRVTCGTLKDAKYPRDFFDVVTLWDVLVMVEDPYEELVECYRVMKQGGVIGIRVRNSIFQTLIYRIYLPVRHVGWKMGVKTPYVFHKFCFSPKSLRILLQRVGFSSIRISNSPLTKGDPYNHTAVKWVTGALKSVVTIVSRIFYGVSGGKWLIGPSLVVWAEKSRPATKSKQVS